MMFTKNQIYDMKQLLVHFLPAPLPPITFH